MEEGKRERVFASIDMGTEYMVSVGRELLRREGKLGKLKSYPTDDLPIELQILRV